MGDLLVIVPSRGRPGRLREMLDASLSLSEALTDATVGFDDDDPFLPAYEALGADPQWSRGHVLWHSGPRDTVAGWTNRLAVREGLGCYRALASLSDDHMPRTPGWDRLLLEAIDGMGGTGFAYGNDLLQGEILSTSVVVSSDIVAALGWLAEPSMRHYRIDNVWKELGEGAGCLAYLPDVIIEHMHPGAGKSGFDATYAAEAPYAPEDDAAWEIWRAQRKAADVATITALMARKADAC